MQPGDAIVFPHGHANLLSSLQTRVADALTLSATPERFPNNVLLNPGPGAKATFVCGFLGCDLRPFNPLLSSLPRQIIVGGAPGDWLAEFPKYALAESREPKPGSESMLTRMAELMFVEVLRRHVVSPSDGSRETGGMARGARRPDRRAGAPRAARQARARVVARRTSRARSARRAPCSSSGSRRWSACRRCSTSRNGVSNSRPTSSREGRRRWRRSAGGWATSPRRRSAERSNARRD